MTWQIEDCTLLVALPDWLAVWIGPQEEIVVTGARSYRGPVPWDQTLRFPAPTQPGVINLRLETMFIHGAPYGENLTIEHNGSDPRQC